MIQNMCKRDVDDMLMSPLAVNTDDMIVVTMRPLEFLFFDALPKKIKLKNNGVTVTLNGLWAADRHPCIVGANLDERYIFSHLHFHWTDVDGSDVVNEHIINGRGHAVEMHLVFFKGSCQTIFEAESIKSGLVTLAYLFNVTENQHSGINHITTNLRNIRTFGQTARIPAFPLSHLVHNQLVEYFTYAGKIDKRGCKCGVTQWIVFTKTCDINQEQMNQFRCMLNKRGHTINRNYRKANPVPAGNNTRPFLVVLDGHSSNSMDGDVETATAEKVSAVEVAVVAGEMTAAVPSLSGGLRQTSRHRSLDVVASANGGNPNWTLSVKPTKTQLLRQMFNLNKLSDHKQWRKTIAITEQAQRADAETESNLRPTFSFNVTRPSWK